VVNSIEVHNHTESRCESVEGPEKTSDVTQVIQHIVDDALNLEPVGVELEDDAAGKGLYGVFRVGRWDHALPDQREEIGVVLQQETNREERITQSQVLHLEADWVLNLAVAEELVAGDLA